MTITNEANPHHNPYLNESARPIFAVCRRLMRQLPDDITNAPSLTLDEAKKAFSVAFYACDIQRTILGGMAELGKLMHDTSTKCADYLPALQRLIHQLSVEAEFMQDVASDYRDAAKEACR